jgi:hypothetical protein
VLGEIGDNPPMVVGEAYDIGICSPAIGRPGIDIPGEKKAVENSAGWETGYRICMEQE